MLPRFNPRMTARGFVSVNGDGVHTPAGALFNNSTGPYVLVIRTIQTGEGANGPIFGFAKNGTIGTVAGNTAPFVTGDSAVNGVLYKDTGTTYTASDFNLVAAQFFGDLCLRPYPFIALSPGWSYVVYNTATGDTDFNVSFFWQAVPIEYLDGLPWDVE